MRVDSRHRTPHLHLFIQRALDDERRLIAAGHYSNSSLPSDTDLEGVQFLHADSIGVADALAREIGALPDSREMERFTREDPELHRCLTQGPILPAHFFLVGPDAVSSVARADILRINKEIEESLEH